MKIKICYIMVGVPGSGKSTFVRRVKDTYAVANVGLKCLSFSLDDCRLEFFGNTIFAQAYKDDKKKLYQMAFEYANDNKTFFDAHVNMVWNDCLKNADCLIVDNTNLTRKSRARWINDSRSKGFTIYAAQVLVPLDVAIERQSQRDDKFVPENTLRDMYLRQQEVLEGSEVVSVMNIDGTL